MLLLEHTCDIKRQEAVGTNGRKQAATIATAVPCLMLPMSAASAVQNGFSVTSAYDVFFSDGQDVKVGDRLVRAARNYTVRGVRPYEVPVVGHLHVLAEREAA